MRSLPNKAGEEQIVLNIMPLLSLLWQDMCVAAADHSAQQLRVAMCPNICQLKRSLRVQLESHKGHCCKVNYQLFKGSQMFSSL